MKVKICKFLFRINTFFHSLIFLEYLQCVSTALGSMDDKTWYPFIRKLVDYRHLRITYSVWKQLTHPLFTQKNLKLRT